MKTEAENKQKLKDKINTFREEKEKKKNSIKI